MMNIQMRATRALHPAYFTYTKAYQQLLTQQHTTGAANMNDAHIEF